MERIAIELETVTATFLHVLPEGEARWRAAPFRGLARWWFRALVGAVHPVGRVRELEAELFGTTEAASPVLVRVFPAPGTRLPNIEASINPGSTGSAARKAIPPGTRATLELVASRGGPHGRAAVREAYAAIWTALHLGGVGQRARRGGGCLQLRAVHGLDDGPGPITAREPKEYAVQLEAGLEAVRRILRATAFRRLSDVGEFPVLHPATAKIRVGRLSVPHDRDARGGPRENGVPEAVLRGALMGLRRDHHRRPDGRREYEFGGISPRLASPLWIRIADRRPDGGVAVMTLLKHAKPEQLGAQWVQAERMMTGLDPHGTWVRLEERDRG